MIALYASGMIVGIVVALLLKNTAFRGQPVPFVMELPNYRMPSVKSVALLLWEKAKDFITRAFTVGFPRESSISIASTQAIFASNIKAPRFLQFAFSFSKKSRKNRRSN